MLTFLLPRFRHSETVSDNPNHNRFLIKDTISSRRRYGDCRLSSVSHMFERKGYIRATPAPDAETSEEVFATAVEAGVDDCDESRPETEEEANAVQEDGIVWEIRCQPTSFDDIVKALQAKGHVLHEAEVKLLPTAPPLRIKYEEEETDGTAEDSTDVATSGWVDTATIEKLDKLRDALEENADCQRIWCVSHFVQGTCEHFLTTHCPCSLTGVIFTAGRNSYNIDIIGLNPAGVFG